MACLPSAAWTRARWRARWRPLPDNFANLLDRYNVAEYYAVATSAVREAANRDALISAASMREAGIELTAIDAA